MVIVQVFAPDVTLSVNARLAIRKRVDLFEANISANKISLPLRAGVTLKENTIAAPKI